MQTQGRLVAIVRKAHAILHQLIPHLRHDILGAGIGQRGRGLDVTELAGVIELSDLFYKELQVAAKKWSKDQQVKSLIDHHHTASTHFVGMIDTQLEANRVQNDPFQQQYSFLQLREFVSFGVQTHGRCMQGGWRRRTTPVQQFLLRYPTGLHPPGSEFETFLDDGVEFFGRLFGLGGQHDGGDGHFESIVVLEGVLGVKPMKEDLGGADGDSRQLQHPSRFFDESTRLAAFGLIVLVGLQFDKATGRP